MTPEKVCVAAVQMRSDLGDKAANLAQAEVLLAEAAGQNAQVACLPELFDVGYDLTMLADGEPGGLAEPVPAAPGEPAGPTVARLQELARAMDLAIVAGVLERDCREPGVVFDAVVIIDRLGQVRGRYRKTHLYPPERRCFHAGNTLPVFRLHGLRVGVAICFEAAFAPIFATLAVRGAQVVFNPSAVPVGYSHLQDLRTAARAQDNQFFVAAVNHVGSEGSATYCGRSQIAGPRGDLMAIAPGDRPATVTAELDLRMIPLERAREPVLGGFRPTLYQLGMPDSMVRDPEATG